MNANGDAAMTFASSASNVFNLYQEGLVPDQVLQLCYLRFHTPRRFRLDRTRIEDEFVLPRPELKIADFLPPAQIPLHQPIEFASPSAPISHGISEYTGKEFTLDQVRESAKTHFFSPRQAAREDVDRWASLAESDWLSLYQSLQRPYNYEPGQDEDMTDVSDTTQVPNIADICWMLEHCPSDAFASFVWDHLLLLLLQQCIGSESLLQQALALLVSRHPLASLSPKDFRAKVRSRNLRQAGDIIGAKAELALAQIYRVQRNHDIK